MFHPMCWGADLEASVEACHGGERLEVALALGAEGWTKAAVRWQRREEDSWKGGDQVGGTSCPSACKPVGVAAWPEPRHSGPRGEAGRAAGSVGFCVAIHSLHVQDAAKHSGPWWGCHLGLNSRELPSFLP